MDLVLSSGLFAFARHLGVLEALELDGLVPDAVLGTSSGALVGALWLSGRTPAAITELLAPLRPVTWLRPNLRPWRGLFSTRQIRRELARQLPLTFADLPRPFAVGVRDARGRHRLVASGPLVDAVLASLAVPVLFAPVDLEGRPHSDGGSVDRLGLDAHAAWRPGAPVLLHEVERTLGKPSPVPPSVARVIRTPRAGATIFGLGAFHFEKEQARQLALSALGRDREQGLHPA